MPPFPICKVVFENREKTSQRILQGEVAMLRRAMPALYFSFILIAIFIQPASGYAETQVLFEKNVKVHKWHLHLSHQRFELNHPTGAILRVTKIAPDKQINGGFVLLNGRLIFLRVRMKGTG